MAAYVASARIARGRPRIAAAERPPTRGLTDRIAAPDARLVDTSPQGQRELELRWEAFSERWHQLTFFLLDPESWR
jgi:hypothetical protein